MDSNGTLILSLIALVLCSGFFSASETAYTSLNRVRVKSQANAGDRRAEKVLALAIGLRLNLDVTVDFLRIAGYALSPISQTDAVVRYFILHEDYNVIKIDMTKTSQSLLAKHTAEEECIWIVIIFIYIHVAYISVIIFIIVIICACIA